MPESFWGGINYEIQTASKAHTSGAGYGACVYRHGESGRGAAYAVAGSLLYRSDSQIEIDEWFCTRTLANPEYSRLIAITVWDPESDRGHAAKREVNRICNQQVPDGYGPDARRQGATPQAKKQLVVDILRIRDFSMQPHTDETVI